jgi:hypothetical protein
VLLAPGWWIAIMPKLNARIISSDGGFAVEVDGEIVRTGFVGRGHAAMWAARKGLYKRETPPRGQVALPSDLEDLRVIKSPQAAKIVGEGYRRFREKSKTGLWGPRVQINGRTFGHFLGDLKRGLASRIIK